MKLSIVTTMYRSAPYIEEFYRRIVLVAEEITDDFEVIMVNDGSPDNSLEIAVSLHNKDSRLKVVDLSRNFGHHKAIMVGLRIAKGDLVFLIDVDLEEEPELLKEFYNQFTAQRELDVLYGVQARRKGGVFEVFSGWLFYKIVNWLCDTPIPKNFLTIRLMTSRYVQELIKYTETQFNFSTLTVLTGFTQKEIKIVKKSTSQSTYTFTKKLVLLLDIITSSSAKPLYIVFYVGMAITFLSFLYIINIIYNVLVLGHGVQGWPSLIVSIWFLGGLICMFIGIVGLYISRIYIETKRRPDSHIRSVWGIEL